MARKKTLEQRLIELIVEHGVERVESALRMYEAATGAKKERVAKRISTALKELDKAAVGAL